MERSQLHATRAELLATLTLRGLRSAIAQYSFTKTSPLVFVFRFAIVATQLHAHCDHTAIASSTKASAEYIPES